MILVDLLVISGVEEGRLELKEGRSELEVEGEDAKSTLGEEALAGEDAKSETARGSRSGETKEGSPKVLSTLGIDRWKVYVEVGCIKHPSAVELVKLEAYGKMFSWNTTWQKHRQI